MFLIVYDDVLYVPFLSIFHSTISALGGAACTTPATCVAPNNYNAVGCSRNMRGSDNI